MIEILSIPRQINIYDEVIYSINFKQIKNFIEKNFGNIKIQYSRLEKKIVQTNGLLFDFMATQKSFEHLCSEDSCDIILTDTLFATLDEDKRPHIRASIYTFPCVISTSGIVEGPAKPKEFYVYKQKYSSLGVWELRENQIKQKFKRQFIDYQDNRITEVIKGYIAQAIFFYITGEPFCDKQSCRLFNAHWQSDLIYSQIKSGKFCRYHEGLLRRIKKEK